RRPPRSPRFPYTTLFRSIVGLRSCSAVARAAGDLHRLHLAVLGEHLDDVHLAVAAHARFRAHDAPAILPPHPLDRLAEAHAALRSEEHTSELQSRENLVC